MPLPVTITYDLANREVEMSGGTGDITVIAAELYSDWKDNMLTNAGLMALPPVWLDSVGGNDLGGGTNLDGYFFFNNDEWTIVPENRDHTITVEGNLFTANPLVALWSFPTADVQVILTLSSKALAVQSGSGLSAAQDAVLTRILQFLEADETIVDENGKMIISHPDAGVLRRFDLDNTSGATFDKDGTSGIGSRTVEP